jgi:hypothetical protein
MDRHVVPLATFSGSSDNRSGALRPAKSAISGICFVVAYINGHYFKHQ